MQKKVQRPPTLSAKTLTAIYNQNRPTHHHMLHALTAGHPPISFDQNGCSTAKTAEETIKLLLNIFFEIKIQASSNIVILTAKLQY